MIAKTLLASYVPMAGARRRLARPLARLRDQRRSTFGLPSEVPAGKLLSYLKPLPMGTIKPMAEQVAGITANYLEHRFDLLGSGWVHVEHGMTCRGLEGYRYDSGSAVVPDRDGQWLEGRINRANLPGAQGIWGQVDEGYKPIDWHLDFKSGHRWGEGTWHRDVRNGHQLGVDVKVPWELARMQHLLQLAWAYALADSGDQHIYLREFRNQVLDFIATNPPRYGVNWACPMECGIRVESFNDWQEGDVIESVTVEKLAPKL